MTESIGVLDQAAGINVACYDANEDDASKTEGRVIQAVDIAHVKKPTMAYAAPTRTVTSFDSTGLTSPITGPIAANILEVGDNSILEVCGRIDAVDPTGMVAITPIVLTAADEPLYILPTKAMSGIAPLTSGTCMQVTIGSDAYSFGHPLTWWVGQYTKVAIHVYIVYTTSVDLWYTLHNGQPNDNFDLFARNADDTVGSQYWEMGTSKTQG